MEPDHIPPNIQQEVKYKIDTPESPEVLVRHVKDIPLKGLPRFAEHISQEDACRLVDHKVSPESDQDVLVCRFLKFEEFDSSFRILTDVYDDTARGSAFLRCLDGPVQARAIRLGTTSYKALRSGLAAAYRDQSGVQQALILEMQERFGRISRQAGEPICDFITRFKDLWEKTKLLPNQCYLHEATICRQFVDSFALMDPEFYQHLARNGVRQVAQLKMVTDMVTDLWSRELQARTVLRNLKKESGVRSIACAPLHECCGHNFGRSRFRRNELAELR
uniref:Uncharacterized protein n=1 Tax=Spongospora subterranea TaxID=70186 RepID=A0A0H5R005_9EUKA|eukprot:CRZ07495.1 hypothetical protein [Spongospora subterranea]